MEDGRSAPPIVPGDLELSEQAQAKETDLQQCIESLQGIICDLLAENERLRRLIADKSLTFEAAHLSGKDGLLRKLKY